MGQACSCLQHRRKLERRASDESTLHDTDGGEFDPDNDELDILIDGSSNGAGELDGLLGSSSSSSSSSRSSGGGRLRGSERSVFTKRNSKSVRTDTDESERTGSSSSGLTSIATLEAEDQLQSSSSRTNSSSNGRLLGQNSGSALSVEQNLDVLRSYQEATGVVRPWSCYSLARYDCTGCEWPV